MCSQEGVTSLAAVKACRTSPLHCTLPTFCTPPHITTQFCPGTPPQPCPDPTNAQLQQPPAHLKASHLHLYPALRLEAQLLV